MLGKFRLVMKRIILKYYVYNIVCYLYNIMVDKGFPVRPALHELTTDVLVK